MVDFSNAQITNLIIHGIGNKSKDENTIITSMEISLVDELTKQYLMQYFFSSFKFDLFYSFKHQSDIHLNEMYTYAKNIFMDKNNFIPQSVNIAKYLYEVSTHPNIKKGELYITHLTGCVIDNKNVDVIGVFKSENKDFYLNVDNTNNGYHIYCQKGINVEKLDKGCIIFNIDMNDGYRVAIVDSNSIDSVYWKESFLNLKEKNNDFLSTTGLLKLCKSYVKEINEMQPTEKATFLNNSLTYFQNHDNFNLDEFSNEVIEEPIYNDKFKAYIAEKCPDSIAETMTNFQISPKAVSKIKRNIKNYIKLDTNIEIRINPKVKNIGQLLEKGYDSIKNMNYYKIYYKDEE